MYNIKLVFTIHKDCHNCNSLELYKIIESVKPEIIFEELSASNFHRSYIKNTLRTLETDAIKMYLQDYPIVHIPVDTFERPERYDEQVDQLIGKITSNKMLQETRDLCSLMDQNHSLEARHGFPYLNSKYNDAYFEEFERLKNLILNQLDTDRWHEIDQQNKEVIEKREETMLINIYEYSKQHQFGQGLFFIGSGHRKSMLQKIKIFNEREKPKMNWTFYDPGTPYNSLF